MPLSAEMLDWVAEQTGCMVISADRLVGGNRRQAWAVDCAGADGTQQLFLRIADTADAPSADIYSLPREAMIYQALHGRGIAIPRLIAVHATRPAILVERVPGTSRYAGYPNEVERAAVARDVMRKLAALHKLDAATLTPLGSARFASMQACVGDELGVWRAMYEEANLPDPLIVFALGWLEANIPDTAGPAVLVHGDAGPGNFLHRNGEVTALVDWELSHLGDPMEDIAWLSMRTTLEPFPDFSASVRAYEQAVGAPIDMQRVLYHRIFVPLRVAIIRHRALRDPAPDGDHANSLISQTVNRRLLIEALHAFLQVPMPQPAPVDVPPPPEQAEYDIVLATLRERILNRVEDPLIRAAVKSSARLIKHLAAKHRYGPALAAQGEAECAALLGVAPAPRPALNALLCDRIANGLIDSSAALTFFAHDTARETQLAADAMGALATRSMPKMK